MYRLYTGAHAGCILVYGLYTGVRAVYWCTGCILLHMQAVYWCTGCMMHGEQLRTSLYTKNIGTEQCVEQQ